MAAESESVAVAIPRAREAPARAVDDPIAKLNQICKAIALGVAITAGATALYFQFYKARFNGLADPVAMDHAQVGMHIARGEGMTTGVVTPLGLQFAPSVERHPDLVNAPAYPHLLAAAFRIRRLSSGTVAACNGLLHLITICALYCLGKVLYSRGVAILTAVLYAASVEAVNRALLGTPVTLAALLLTLSVLLICLLMRRERLPARHESEGRTGPYAIGPVVKAAAIVGAAILFALAYLSGYISLILLVPLVLVLWFGFRQSKGLAAIGFLVVALACCAPWALRNWKHTHTVFAPVGQYMLISGTDAHPTETVFRAPEAVPSDPLSFVIAHPAQMGKKLARGLTHLYRRLPWVVSIYLFPFLVVGAISAKAQRDARILWRAIIAMGVLQLLTAAVWGFDLNHLLILAPVGTCLAVGSFQRLLEANVSSRMARAGLIVLLIGVAAFPYVVSVLPPRAEPPIPFQSLAILREQLPPDAVIATNVPQAVACYARKKAVWLPVDAKGLGVLQSKGAGIDYLYLSRLTTPSVLGQEQPDFWTQMLARPDPNEIAKLGRVGILPGRELLIELSKSS